MLLDVVGTLTQRSQRIENLTPAVFFRVIEKYRPTMLVDECDRHLRDNAMLEGMLNSGFTRGGVIPRCEGDGNELRFFKVFAPVALCGIGELPGNLPDRSIKIPMERAKRGEIRVRFDSRHIELETELKRRLMRWTADNKAALVAADPRMPAALFNRVADVWRPLFAVAQVAGGEWPMRAAVAFTKIQRPDADSEPVAVQCLQDVADVMDKADAEIMATHDLVDRLILLDERPWQTWNKGRPISPRQLARLLRGFGVVPTAHRDGGTVFKGYRRASLNDALSRYAPVSSDLSVTELQPSNGAASDDFLSVTPSEPVTDELPLKPLCDAACNRVTDKTPPISDKPSLEQMLAVDRDLAGGPEVVDL